MEKLILQDGFLLEISSPSQGNIWLSSHSGGGNLKCYAYTQAPLEILKPTQKAESERQIPFLSVTVPRQELSSAAVLLLVGFALLFSIEATT